MLGRENQWLKKHVLLTMHVFKLTMYTKRYFILLDIQTYSFENDQDKQNL